MFPTCGSIADINLQGDEELVSFDVVSLFTSIPVDVAVNVAHNRLVNDENLPERTALSVTDVIKLLDFCLSTTNFQYGHEHYQQIHGTAMGSPVSAVMANMVMEDLEERALTTLTNQPLFWKRFVDDVSTTTKFDSTQTFLEHLNSIEPCIKFTVERESEGKIAFLDTMVHHQEDGRLTTTVYRKPTHTDRYLSFSSHHPSMHKRAVVKSLMDRAERIPTTKSDRSKEKQRVISTLQSNGYPKRFILDASKPKRPPKDTINAAESGRGYSTIPYVSGTSEPIKRVLENHGIKVAFKPYQTMSQMFPKPKDQIDKEETRGPVYDIPCADCSKSYVGETQRKFSTRKGEHQKAVARRQCKKSALADHVTNTNHDIAWDEATILRTNSNWHQRKILEAWEINCARDPLNRDDGALLPKEYLHLTLANKKK
ncbi:uncharacterized protein [Montipora capricornis]|uniref:uncharacterized protein n=1 Tax=Montipora capricornis TaxID=246305 RepID=UPI0035F2013C